MLEKRGTEKSRLISISFIILFGKIILYIFFNGTSDKLGSTVSIGFIDVSFELAFCGVYLAKTCKNFIGAFIEVLEM